MKTVLANIGELIKYKELFREIVFREIKGRYKQSIFGIGWVIMQPLATMVVFTIVFGKIAKIDAGIAYPVFAYAGLLPWTFFTNSINKGAQSLTHNINLVTKVYFPRMIFPSSAILSAGFDLIIAATILVALFFIYKVQFSIMMLWFPILLLIQMILAFGITLILSASNVFFRDITPMTTLGLQIWLYLTPVVYPSRLVPHKYQFLFNLNPMTSLMESYKNVLLFQRGPDDFIWYTVVFALIILYLGVKMFNKLEPKFADII